MKSKIKKGLGLLKKIILKKDFFSRSAYYLLQNRVELDNKTILYESYHAKNISCNPYAIYLALLDDTRFKDYIHVWIVKGIPNKSAKNTYYIKQNSFKHAYYLLRAKYLINNNTFAPFVSKQKEQVYINTWHGTPLKMLGSDANLADGIFSNVTRNFLHVDYFISPNRYSSDIFLQAHSLDTLFEGAVIEEGYPRNDLLFMDEDRKNRLKNQLKITKKVILYAPTFRGSHLDSHRDTKVYEQFISQLQERFSQTYDIVTKLHHINQNDTINAKRVADDIDTNELLSIVDILITDYSSIAFDFLLLKRPILYFTFDLESYIKERGLYFDIHEMAGVVCESAEQIIDEIKNIDTFMPKHQEKYEKNIAQFLVYDDGESSKKVIDKIFFSHPIKSKNSQQNRRKKILLYAGNFLNNGVTSSVLALLNQLDYSKYEIFLISNTDVDSSDFKRTIERIPHEVSMLYVPHGTIKLFQKFYRYFSGKFLAKLFERENHNFFGDTYFDMAIDYSGYGGYWASMMAYANAKHRYIYLHNDMREESIKRKNILDIRLLERLYSEKFTKLICVSDSSLQANQKNFASLSEKMCVVNNPIDVKRIKELSERKEDIIENFDRTKTNFINIARYSVEKAQERLIEAFVEVVKKESNTHLYIVGHGPLHVKLQESIDRLNMSRYITLSGNMDNPFALLKLCDCFVLSSFYEGQGLVLLEALVLDVEVISVDIAGPQSILSEGEGVLCENSKEGLVFAMQGYLDGVRCEHKFDYTAYTNRAMQNFYETII